MYVLMEFNCVKLFDTVKLPSMVILDCIVTFDAIKLPVIDPVATLYWALIVPSVI